MNDSMSILLATTILALGGLGLYVYKSANEEYNEEYNEDNLFSNNFWGVRGTDNDDTDEDIEGHIEEDDFKPRKRNSKTQRNKKSIGSSRRRY
jgi:hypothetical protein